MLLTQVMGCRDKWLTIGLGGALVTGYIGPGGKGRYPGGTYGRGATPINGGWRGGSTDRGRGLILTTLILTSVSSIILV